LPPLSGDENIRDFIACVTQAMIADIILENSGTKYLLRRPGSHTPQLAANPRPQNQPA